MVMRSEKWAIFAILVMVLLIATFNMVGTLSMLVLQKEKDIAILQAMGAQQSTIRSVFLLEGIMWSVIGGAGGMLIGIGVCLIQQKWHIVGMGSTFEVAAFPVEIQLRDVVLDLVTVTAIGLLVSWYPAVKATKVGDPSLKSA
jgi:lipoprotein-releasing system permease protein